MAVVGVLTAGYGSKLAILGKAAVLTNILKAGRGAEEAAEVANLVYKAEGFIETAVPLKRFGPLEAGPLHEISTGTGTVADTFRSSSYYQVLAKEDTTLYRVYNDGGEGNALGAYWSRIKPSGPLQAQLDSALNPAWGNIPTSFVEIKIPAGTTFFEGAVSSTVLEAAGSKLPIGQLYGGGSQIYIQSLLDRKWITATGVF